MTAFVKSVEYVEITLTDAGPTSVNLTKSQTIADCVPFFTNNLTNDIRDPQFRRYIEVFFEAGPKVTAQRGNGTGTVIVGVFVVEFDTSGDISVQQGTWDTVTGATTEAISSVTTTKAFVVINYRSDHNQDDFNDAQGRVVFNSGTELAFDRVAYGGTHTGRYYVVSTTGSDFTVEHATIAVGATDETTETTISSTVTTKTFLIQSSTNDETSDDVIDGHVIVDLKDSTTIRARRAFDSFGGSPGAATSGADLAVQVIEAQGTEFSVERAECDWGDSLTKAVTVTEIDQTKAIIVGGGRYGEMSANAGFGADLDGSYAVLSFTSDTEVTGTRASNTVSDGTTFFEVVEFELAGAGGGEVAVGVATETDLALAIGGLKALGFTVAAETDSAQGVNPVRSALLGTAGEIDIGFAIPHRKDKPVGVATETDASLALGRLKEQAIALAAEIDTTFPIPHRKDKPIGTAGETDAALALGPLKELLITLAGEADTTFAVSASRAKTLGVAGETDTAFVITWTKAKPLGVAGETNSAFVVTWAKAKTLGLATEVDTALTVRPERLVPITLALELDTTFALVGEKARVIGIAGETDTALVVLTGGLSALLGVALETDSALLIGLDKARTLGIAPESDSAPVVRPVRLVPITLAAETDTALAIPHSKAVLLGIAAETDLALALVAVGGGAPAAGGWLIPIYRRRRR